MTTLEFEADKARLVRAIINIDNKRVLEEVKRNLRGILNLSQGNEMVTDDITQKMLQRFSGKWSDDRSAEEIIEDIYHSRFSCNDDQSNPFDE